MRELSNSFPCLFHNGVGQAGLSFVWSEPHGMWDVSSPTRNWTCALAGEAWNPNHWASSWSLKWGEGGYESRDQTVWVAWEMYGWSCHPLMVLCSGIMWNKLLLLLTPQKGLLDFWSLCILLLIICPNCSCMQVFSVPYTSSFCCWRRHLSRGKHCSKGTQGQVPACLILLWGILHPLFLRVKGLKVSYFETSSWWTGATDPRNLAYSKGVEVPCWLFRGPVGIWVTLW